MSNLQFQSFLLTNRSYQINYSISLQISPAIHELILNFRNYNHSFEALLTVKL